MRQETEGSYLEQRKQMRRKSRNVWLAVVIGWILISGLVLRPILKHIETNRKADARSITNDPAMMSSTIPAPFATPV